jgi:glycosyltransferase involved in cell wall biosynthesis
MSSRSHLVSSLGLDPDRVTVTPLGVDSRFSPGGDRSPDPLVVAVGRLAPVKRFDLLIDTLVEVRRKVPRLRAVIVGDGLLRAALDAKVASLGASEWIDVAGHLSDDALLDTYRRAWVLASASRREGWNMTITEAGACGTPAVATDIVGHRDSVAHDSSGLLVEPGAPFVEGLVRVLTDAVLRARLGEGAAARARALTWDATAATTLAALIAEAEARHSPR